jgi:hypothetical protein
MAAALRPWSQRAAVTAERKSLLDTLLDTAEVLTEQPRTTLLDEIVAEGRLAERPMSVTITTHLEMPPAVQMVPVAEEIRMVGFQLLDWTLVLIPCPACQCYPCKPGHVNGHTEEWIASQGDLVQVRI